MRRSELLFILLQVTLKFWRFTFWKTQKCYMMSSCMTKLEFLPEPYMIFRLGKLPHICCLLVHWVLSICDPYERFVMLLKSRSLTHHLHMHYSYTGGEHKNMLVRFFIHQINAPSSYWYLSQSFVAEKRHGAMQKYWKKMDTKMSEILKTMGTKMPA